MARRCQEGVARPQGRLRGEPCEKMETQKAYNPYGNCVDATFALGAEQDQSLFGGK